MGVRPSFSLSGPAPHHAASSELHQHAAASQLWPRESGLLSLLTQSHWTLGPGTVPLTVVVLHSHVKGCQGESGIGSSCC